MYLEYHNGGICEMSLVCDQNVIKMSARQGLCVLFLGFVGIEFIFRVWKTVRHANE